MSCESDHRPNIWALRLIETVADNLSVSNPELNAAYKDCLRALNKNTKSQKPKLTLVGSTTRASGG